MGEEANLPLLLVQLFHENRRRGGGNLTSHVGRNEAWLSGSVAPIFYLPSPGGFSPPKCLASHPEYLPLKGFSSLFLSPGESKTLTEMSRVRTLLLLATYGRRRCNTGFPSSSSSKRGLKRKRGKKKSSCSQSGNTGLGGNISCFACFPGSRP